MSRSQIYTHDQEHVMPEDGHGEHDDYPTSLKSKRVQACLLHEQMH